MVKTNKMVTGLIAGAALGAVAGLLFAPKPGKESRQIVTAQAVNLLNNPQGLPGQVGQANPTAYYHAPHRLINIPEPPI